MITPRLIGYTVCVCTYAWIYGSYMKRFLKDDKNSIGAGLFMIAVLSVGLIAMIFALEKVFF